MSLNIPFLLWLTSADEWRNFLTRINRDENAPDSELFGNQNDILELRLWASYRGQTLARTGLLSSINLFVVYLFDMLMFALT
jgi:callose synthase